MLKNITAVPENKVKLANLLRNLLPFVDDVDIEKYADRSLFFKLREIYAPDSYLPASLLSDGTINLTALVAALYFEETPLVIIEEPEWNIHPFLLS